MTATRSFVAVPSAGASKMATVSYADGGDTKHDEVMTHGEPVMPTYSGVTGYGIALNVALSHPIQIMAGATNVVYVRRILVQQAAMATAAAIHDVSVVRLTTAGTGGGAVAFAPHDSTDPAAGATAMSLPTALGVLGNTLWRKGCYFCQTMPVSGVGDTGLIADIDCDRMRIKPFRIPAGTANGLCLRLTTAPAVATGVVTVTISEAPY